MAFRDLGQEAKKQAFSEFLEVYIQAFTVDSIESNGILLNFGLASTPLGNSNYPKFDSLREFDVAGLELGEDVDGLKLGEDVDGSELLLRNTKLVVLQLIHVLDELERLWTSQGYKNFFPAVYLKATWIGENIEQAIENVNAYRLLSSCLAPTSSNYRPTEANLMSIIAQAPDITIDFSDVEIPDPVAFKLSGEPYNVHDPAEPDPPSNLAEVIKVAAFAEYHFAQQIFEFFNSHNAKFNSDMARQFAAAFVRELQGDFSGTFEDKIAELSSVMGSPAARRTDLDKIYEFWVESITLIQVEVQGITPTGGGVPELNLTRDLFRVADPTDTHALPRSQGPTWLGRHL